MAARLVGAMTNLDIPEGTVTVLFTDLVESTHLNQTLGDDAAREVGRRVDEMARSVVTANRGALIKEMGDGLMAAFTSARRAIAAAREMQLQLRRLRRDGLDAAVQMRIGIHTGEVIDEDGDLHGETVIIAKRIEGLAPAGGILASNSVHGVLGTARDELIDQGAATLKGIEAEWRLWLVPVPEDHDGDQETLATSDLTPYVGRVAERAQLRVLLESALEGRGAMALVGGPPGLGKTRLVRETATIAEQMGFVVYTGNCLDMESPPPYQPAIDHLEQAARRATPEGFRSALGVNAPEVAKLLPSLRQRYDDIPASPDLTPEQERRYMLHGVGEFIERAAKAQPMVLVYEDLHWADESTLLLLHHLGGRLAGLPLVVIGTYRDDELAPSRPLTTAIGPLLRDVRAVDIRPQLLTVDEVREVLASRAGLAPPHELVDLVVEETQGNPFFVEELFRHLRDAGKLFDEEGKWRSGFEIGATEVPQGIKLLIARRLDQLDPSHRRVLAAAAVIGRRFSFRHLATVADASEDELFDVIEAAEHERLIEELPVDHPADYVFVQEQIRQTLVGELSLPRRQRIHVRVADAIEAQGSASPVEVAHHLLSAGPAAPAERTGKALIAAARLNLDALAFEDALRHLDNATALVDDDGRFELARLQAGALRGAGRVDDALAVLGRELERTSDRAQEVTLRLQRVQLLNDQYRAAEGLDDLDALVAADDETDDPDLSIAVQLARGRAHYILSLDQPGHAEIARDAYEAAYAAAADQGDKASMARALLPTTWFTDYWTDYAATAERNVAEALALAEEIGDEDLQLDALAASLQAGGVYANQAKSEELLARLERRRDPVKLNAHCFWMMWQHLVAGQFERAVATCDRGIELAELIGSAPVQYGSIKAMALSYMGRFDEVDAALAEEVTDDDHPFGRVMASLARSAHLVNLGAWGPAAVSLAETLEGATAMARVRFQLWAGSLLAVVAAHCRAETEGEVPDPAAIPSFGTWSGGLTAAQVALADGDPARALALASPLLPTGDETPLADHVAIFDVAARSQNALGDHAAALDAATRGIERAEPMRFGAILWRLRAVRALAFAGLGRAEDAERESKAARAEVVLLSARIIDLELRAWFERQTSSFDDLAEQPPIGREAGVVTECVTDHELVRGEPAADSRCGVHRQEAASVAAPMHGGGCRGREALAVEPEAEAEPQRTEHLVLLEALLPTGLGDDLPTQVPTTVELASARDHRADARERPPVRDPAAGRIQAREVLRVDPLGLRRELAEGCGRHRRLERRLVGGRPECSHPRRVAPVSEVEVGVEWLAELAADVLVDGHAADASGQLAEDVAVGLGVVTGNGPRLVPELGVLEHFHDVVPVVELVDGDRAAKAGQSRLVQQNLPGGHGVLAMTAEVGPVVDDRRVEVEQAAIDKKQDGDHQNHLRRGEHSHDGVGLPGLFLVVVAGPTPQVDDGLAVQRHSQRRTLVDPAVEESFEGLLDRAEALVAEPVYLRHAAPLAHRATPP